MNPSLTRAPQRAASALVLPPHDSAAHRRLGLLDRLSLRLGLWLLVRGAARADALERRAASAVERARRTHDATVARRRRERAWQRAAALNRPPV